MSRAASLVSHDHADPFALVEPPGFELNDPAISALVPEVTGYRLLQRIWTRLGWPSLAGKRLLDYGCGVRFARTVHNLALPIGHYTGVDLNPEVVDWLRAHLGDDPRFTFAHVDARNAHYNPGGRELGPETLAALGIRDQDAVCMHSVITHQNPREAAVTFRLLRPAVVDGGRLHFTARADDLSVEGYAEGAPDDPGHLSNYHPDVLLELVEGAGWRVDAIFPRDPGGLGQTTFVATAV